MKKHLLLFALLLLISGAMFGQEPIVITNAPDEVSTTTATCGGTITNEGGTSVTTYGISYTSNFATGVYNIPGSELDNNNSFTVNLTYLEPGTTYYFYAYAANDEGTGYGDTLNFTTPTALPSVTTSPVTNIQQTTATGGGIITDNGGDTINAYGISYSTTADFEGPFGTHIQGSNLNDNSFTVDLTNLEPKTTYYVKAYASNSAGFNYGEEESFTTLPTLYEIIVEANPLDGGEVTGGGSYQDGDTCTVTATPAIGYHFVKWTKGDQQVSTNANYTFTVTENTALMAHFQLNSYTITLVPNPNDGGTVSGGGTFEHDANCTVHASAYPGYTFINWTENEEVVSEENPYEFHVTRNCNLVANFSTSTYTITAFSDPSVGGTVTGNGTYDYNIQANLTATPNDGYTFVNWTKNESVVSLEPSFTFPVIENATYVAHFTQVQYPINIEASEGGIVTISQYEAPADSTITITINEYDGFELDTITVYNTNNPLQTIPVSNYQFTMPNCPVTVKVEFKQTALEITAPDPICSGESLSPIKPSDFWAQDGVWQLSPTENFNPENTITYTTDQPLDVSYNGWYLRYHFQIGFFIWNSNIVQITVNSLEGLTLEGNESVNTYQEVEYQVIDSINNYANYSYDWSISDEQADITIIDNGCKVAWKTIGTQEVSVIVTDNTTGCTETLRLDVEVTACIDNLQEIVEKTHKEGNNQYVLILVYPNPTEEYTYQWRFSSDGEIYSDLKEGTYNKQYYYKGGQLKEGHYKVRISKGDNCSVETNPYHVQNVNSHLRIYPNPSYKGNNLVVVKDCEGTAHLTIYSTDGRLLHTQMVTDNQASISINLPLGVYVAYLTNSEGYTKVGKLIIQ